MADVKLAPGVLTNPYLPWDSPEGEERRFRAMLIFFLILVFVISVVIEMTTVPKPDRRDVEKIPERLAKLVLEKKVEPPPPPPPPPEELPKDEESPKEEKPDEKPVEEKVAKAKEKAQKAIAEAKEELSAMQDLASAFDFGNNQPLTKAGATAGTGGISRDLIQGRSGKGSGGVNIGTTSSGGGGLGVAGGGKLASLAGTQVTSSITDEGTGATRKSADGKLARTTEEIKRILETKNGGAIYAIYQRALRANPTLRGEVVFRLVIAPDGSVSQLEILSSQLNDPELEKKLIIRIKAVNFGAIEGVAVWDGPYTMNFFPG